MKVSKKPLILLVPRAGLEPACPFGRWILSPLRLPFRHLGIYGLWGGHRPPCVKIVPERCVIRQAIAHLADSSARSASAPLVSSPATERARHGQRASGRSCGELTVGAL